MPGPTPPPPPPRPPAGPSTPTPPPGPKYTPTVERLRAGSPTAGSCAITAGSVVSVREVEGCWLGWVVAIDDRPREDGTCYAKVACVDPGDAFPSWSEHSQFEVPISDLAGVR